ncbi:MAG TPA: rhodanese-like domain-containing protein [Rhodocyclaceae bacterium]|nr:rhodanese-like domain-containing protein [Rhodocyclaceae bacterium]
MPETPTLQLDNAAPSRLGASSADSRSGPPPAARQIDVPALLALLADGAEIALIDVREEGEQARDGHIIHAVPLPLSRLELRLGDLLPRQRVRVVVIDAGDGALADRAAAKLASLGFSAVSVLRGGVAAWRDAGQEVYTGDSAYSKTFGEFVEHTYATPHVSAPQLRQRLTDGDDLLLLDGRTLPEFEDFSIPGAHAVPNAELPYRVHGLLKSPQTLVVINCAGRTRSIIGAQTLINAGLPNPVVALENGTMDWLAEGFALQHGERREAPPPAGEALEAARAATRTLTRRFDLQWLDDAQLQAFRDARDTHTLYLYDVRSRAEFEAGHLPDARWAEGGQLVQGVDKFVGVRNARVVVVDDELGVRAAVTASWLVQLGWAQVFAHATRPRGDGRVQGAQAAPAYPPLPAVETLTATELADALRHGQAVVIDLATSPAYEAGHIPGARFAVRARLQAPQLRDLVGKGQTLVLTSPDGVLATFAAPELAALASAPVRVLDGGTAAWKAARQPLETGATALLHPADDVWRSPYQAADPLSAFREYLDWEINLLRQFERDATVSFRVFA